MIVVSNTGPLIALAKVEALPLLKAVFEEVRIPPAMHRELLAKVGPEARHLYCWMRPRNWPASKKPGDRVN